MSGHKVLICGQRSFAAQGLQAALEAAGEDVSLFSRGMPGRSGNVISGAVEEARANPFLDVHYDTVVNYIVLKGMPVAANIAYFQSLLELCQARGVKHLIHISSLSVYVDHLHTITENSPVKSDPASSGSYAALKIAAEQYLQAHTPAGIRLSLLRPAFILGPGLKDPIGSAGVRLPCQAILVMGNPACVRPVMARYKMNQAVARVVAAPPEQEREVLLLVDRKSPTCAEYLQSCCELLGAGRHIVASRWGWIPFLVRREIQKGLRRGLLPRIVRSIRAGAIVQAYNPQDTELRLGLSLSADWKAELSACTSTGTNWP
jgi:nucleoside-diphosphate-sugar epimerase